MARLRTSLVNAINNTREQLKNNKVTVEEAAHNAALTFNENEEEILNKVKSYIEKESRKTGKVGRPAKKQNVVPSKTKNKKAASKTNQNKTKKNNVKMVADSDKNSSSSNENIKKTNYAYSGDVIVKNYGVESKLNVTIQTNESDFNKAKEYVLKKFYDNNILVFIDNKTFEKNLKNA